MSHIININFNVIIILLFPILVIFSLHFKIEDVLHLKASFVIDLSFICLNCFYIFARQYRMQSEEFERKVREMKIDVSLVSWN